jgi:hypothetical protein
MKRLVARSATALLGASLILVVVQSATPDGVTATGRTPSAAVVAQARAHFIKVMSSHGTALGKGGTWVSPGLKHPGSAKASNGTVSLFPSINWSGYGDEESATNTVTYVSGDWTIPAVQCPTAPYQNSDAFLANWVGIDGLDNGTVEQLGTGAQCYEGVTYYYDWVEMFPANTVVEGPASCNDENINCPEPGDRVSASVTVTPDGTGNNNYTLTLIDHTRPQESFSVTASCATATCVDGSGEWVVERPAFSLPFGFQILPAADFTRTGFTSGHITSGGRTTNIQGFQDGPVYDIPMIDDSLSYYLACVDQPAPPGSLLLVTDASACPVATPTRRGGFEESWDAGF